MESHSAHVEDDSKVQPLAVVRNQRQKGACQTCPIINITYATHCTCNFSALALHIQPQVMENLKTIFDEISFEFCANKQVNQN